MSRKLTIITEVITGLGTIPSFDLPDLAGNQPVELSGVDGATWADLQEWWRSGNEDVQFRKSFAHGRYLLQAPAGLRGRHPFSVEWKGPQVAPEESPIPADLRIDHVYIVSCKNLSKVLANPSPASLFKTALRDHDVAGTDWYQEIAPIEYRALLEATTKHLGLRDYPSIPTELTRAQRSKLKLLLGRSWPEALGVEVASWITAVSQASAARLQSVLKSRHEQERFYWRLMRIHSSPYFILGEQPAGPTRLMVLTPWDLRRKYEFKALDISADQAGQPQVRWTALFVDKHTNEHCVTHGHFEVRWSHGKFCGAPESKVYLDTPHAHACGYVTI